MQLLSCERSRRCQKNPRQTWHAVVVRSVSVSPPAKRLAQAVSLTAGRLTGLPRMLPAFLIVGAQRCGTTSMYRTLSQHPAVLKAVRHKGVHYFDMNYGRSLGWYQAHFPLTARARRTEKTVGVTPLTFESSPYYMFHPLAATRIARDLPGVKLVVLVRDPVERAYSGHAHELARGFENEPFERALELEADRIRGEAERIMTEPDYLSHSHQHHAYRTRGQYADQLEALEQQFGADRLHVVDSGDFFTTPEAVYDGVLDFLRLPRHRYPVFERHNARPRAAMPETLRAKLDDHFLPFDERLARWLGDVPSWRRSPPG
jgi:hypothetical protein